MKHILYHGTNMHSYNQMKNSNYIGLDISDYKKMTYEMSNLYNVPVTIFDNIIKSISNDSEANGSVSFFMKKHTVETHVSFMAKYHGEWKGLFVKSCLKKICRIKKIKFTKEIVDSFFGNPDKTPVILEVVVYEKEIVNTKNLNSDESEIFTKSKIPFDRIQRIFIC